jgi:hypothetical protein
MTDDPPGEARVKGTKIKSKLAFVEEAYGAETLHAVVEHMPAEDGRRLKSVLDLAWYPIGIYDRLLAAIVRVAGNGDAEILDRMGRETAEYQAENAYGVYFRSGDPRALLGSMVPMHHQINRPAHMELVDTGERSLSLLVTDPPTTLLTCRLARAFYQRAVELVGGSQAKVHETACQARGDGQCRFDVRW